MQLSAVVATSAAVGATRSRKEKAALLADALRTAAADPDADLAVVASYLAGLLPQRRTGLGWRGLTDLPDPAAEPTLTVAAVDAKFAQLEALSGPGSQSTRRAAVAELFAAATADEQHWLRGLVTGEVRQGALDSLLQDAVAQAADVPLTAVRRAAMLAGSTPVAVVTALREGADGLVAVVLEPGRPISPMLAGTAPSVAEAVVKVTGPAGGPVAVEAKLDGIRVQAHRVGGEVTVVTRSLDDVTARLGAVVDVVRSLPGGDLVLDGEAMGVGDDGRPLPFQDTASVATVLRPWFFDLLHRDGEDLLDAPFADRAAALADLVPAEHRVERLVTADAGEAEAFARRTLDAGHEGVIVKALDSPYAAGRRGAGWVKVKPVHTLDLVVLAAERGSGRRRGWLSNIHLGARDPDGGGFVMVGKTFKGMTDETLAWQTERFTALAEGPTDGHVVAVRPKQVVEIAFDGVQRSSRYPGGVALRFARVLRYRGDKTADQSDTIDALRAYLG